MTEGRTVDLGRQASVVLNITEHLVKGMIRQSGPNRLATAALMGTGVAGALYWRQQKRPQVSARCQPLRPVMPEHVSTRMAAHAERYTRGEDRWRQAELGTPGDTLPHRAARMLVRFREPLTRTAIVERLGEAVPGAGHTDPRDFRSTSAKGSGRAERLKTSGMTTPITAPEGSGAAPGR